LPPRRGDKVEAMPIPLVWRRGLPGEIVFQTLAEWTRTTSAASTAVDAEHQRVAAVNLRACRRRLVQAGWELSPSFKDASEVVRPSYDGVALRELHGPPRVGQPGVQAVTYAMLAFANEVVRQAGRQEGIQPWVREIFAAARAHYHRWESSPVHTAAMAFDRMRREWPDALILEEELLYAGLDIRYARCPKDIPALAALSALLRRTKDEVFTEANLVNFEYAVRGGGFLADPPLRVAKYRKRRMEGMLGGVAAPIWASWMLDGRRPRSCDDTLAGCLCRHGVAGDAAAAVAGRVCVHIPPRREPPLMGDGDDGAGGRLRGGVVLPAASVRAAGEDHAGALGGLWPPTGGRPARGRRGGPSLCVRPVPRGREGLPVGRGDHANRGGGAWPGGPDGGGELLAQLRVRVCRIRGAGYLPGGCRASGWLPHAEARRDGRPRRRVRPQRGSSVGRPGGPLHHRPPGRRLGAWGRRPSSCSPWWRNPDGRGQPPSPLESSAGRPGSPPPRRPPRRRRMPTGFMPSGPSRPPIGRRGSGASSGRVPPGRSGGRGRRPSGGMPGGLPGRPRQGRVPLPVPARQRGHPRGQAPTPPTVITVAVVPVRRGVPAGPPRQALNLLLRRAARRRRRRGRVELGLTRRRGPVPLLGPPPSAPARPSGTRRHERRLSPMRKKPRTRCAGRSL